jgi:hypothetical protein
MLAWALENAAPLAGELPCALMGASTELVLDGDAETLKVQVSISLCMGMKHRNERGKHDMAVSKRSMAASKRRWRRLFIDVRGRGRWHHTWQS